MVTLYLAYSNDWRSVTYFYTFWIITFLKTLVIIIIYECSNNNSNTVIIIHETWHYQLQSPEFFNIPTDAISTILSKVELQCPRGMQLALFAMRCTFHLTSAINFRALLAANHFPVCMGLFLKTLHFIESHKFFVGPVLKFIQVLQYWIASICCVKHLPNITDTFKLVEGAVWDILFVTSC